MVEREKLHIFALSDTIYKYMVDIFERLEESAGGPIGQYMSRVHGYFAFPKLEGCIGPHMQFRGREVLNWSLNNYLGLANHPEVRRADAAAAAAASTGSQADRPPASGVDPAIAAMRRAIRDA